MTGKGTKVVCVDVGSVRRGKFAWYSNARRHGSNPDTLVAYLHTLRESGDRVALGFECPAWIPVPQDAIDLGAKRNGEGRYPWSAGAGAGALATGLAQIAWTLKNLAHSEQSQSRMKATELTVTTSRERWNTAKAGEWLLWEAFVPGDRKPASDAAKQHIADARAGVDAFKKIQVINDSDPTGDAVNLLAVMADWAGLSVSADEKHQPLPIYGPPAASKKT